MLSVMETLAAVLRRQLPDGMDYDDAARLSLRLYCVSNGVPLSLRALTTLKNLAETFAALSRAGWVHGPANTAALYGANLHEVTDRGHWIEVIGSLFKRPDFRRDDERGEEMFRLIHFDGDVV